jgi:polysaccharide biosynthesis/export protein
MVRHGNWFLRALMAAAMLCTPLAVHGQSVLRPGDMLQIGVWPSTELSGEFVIEETGYIYLPLLERVQAAGVPIDRLRADLRARYGEVMRNPVVTITPVFHVTITGEVQRPGVIPISPTHSLFDVVGLAGGFRPMADQERLRIVRAGEVMRFDALRALETGEGMDAIQLRSGDHIVVPVSPPARLTWRNALTVLQTVSIIAITYERLTR